MKLILCFKYSSLPQMKLHRQMQLCPLALSNFGLPYRRTASTQCKYLTLPFLFSPLFLLVLYPSVLLPPSAPRALLVKFPNRLYGTTRVWLILKLLIFPTTTDISYCYMFNYSTLSFLMKYKLDVTYIICQHHLDDTRNLNSHLLEITLCITEKETNNFILIKN